jgi:hypothetical protein
MITIKHTAADPAAAAKLQQALRNAGFEVTHELQRGKAHIFIPVLSPAAISDPHMEQSILHALDQGQFIIPALAQKTTLPAIIEHLEAADLSRDLSIETLIERIRMYLAQGQHVVMKVHTPRTRAGNRNLALILAFLSLFMCGVGILLVGGGVAQFPGEEYNAVDTSVASTVRAEIDSVVSPLLPRSTQEAAQFASTAQAVPTRYRPYLIATATAQASQP